MMTTNRKKIIGILAMNVAAMLLGVVCGGVLHSRTDKGIELSTKATEVQGGALIDAGRSNGVKLTSTKLTAGEYAANGVSAQTESAYTLTASVYPEDALCKVDWTVSFTNAASAWASGKTVTDYVTVSTATDGALTAVVENKAAFGEQIQVKVSNRENPDVYATCQVEYLQRTEGYSFALHGNFHYQVSTLANKTASIRPDFISSPEAVTSITVNKSTVYTRANTDYATYYRLEPTREFEQAIKNAGLSVSALKVYSGGSGGEAKEFFGSEWGRALYGSSAANKNKLINAISGFSGNAYQVSVMDMEGMTGLALFYVTFDASTILGQKEILRMEVDEAELVF